MKAVIETGGKQYYVEEGTVLYIEKLEAENEELVLHRNENEKRKLLLLERDNAKLENLSGYDEAIRQINEEIKYANSTEEMNGYIKEALSFT